MRKRQQAILQARVGEARQLGWQTAILNFLVNSNSRKVKATNPNATCPSAGLMSSVQIPGFLISHLLIWTYIPWTLQVIP